MSYNLILSYLFCCFGYTSLNQVIFLFKNKACESQDKVLYLSLESELEEPMFGSGVTMQEQKQKQVDLAQQGPQVSLKGVMMESSSLKPTAVVRPVSPGMDLHIALSVMDPIKLNV